MVRVMRRNRTRSVQIATSLSGKAEIWSDFSKIAPICRNNSIEYSIKNSGSAISLNKGNPTHIGRMRNRCWRGFMNNLKILNIIASHLIGFTSSLTTVDWSLQCMGLARFNCRILSAVRLTSMLTDWPNKSSLSCFWWILSLEAMTRLRTRCRNCVVWIRITGLSWIIYSVNWILS